MRLIDADELLRLSHRFHISEFDRDGFEIIYADTVRNAPTVEAQKTGKWREYNYPGQEHVYCSSCKEEYYVDDLLLGRNEYPNYCPNCGARMECEEE